MKYSFETVDGKILLVVTIPIWSDGDDDDVIKKYDVTDKVMPVVDDYLDHQLGLDKYPFGK